MKNIIEIFSTTALVSLLCSIGLSKPVHAGTLTYNLGSGGSGTTNASSFTYDIGDIGDPILTVTGTEAGETRDVQQRNNGLGIIGEEGRREGQIDGRGGTFEGLVLSFDRAVSIVSASFNQLQGNDGFRLLVGDDPLVTVEAGLNSNNPYDFSSLPVEDRTDSKFTFTVSQRNDDYRLASVTVREVPEPSSVISLLALGFVGLSSYRKVKSF